LYFGNLFWWKSILGKIYSGGNLLRAKSIAGESVADSENVYKYPLLSTETITVQHAHHRHARIVYPSDFFSKKSFFRQSIATMDIAEMLMDERHNEMLASVDQLAVYKTSCETFSNELLIRYITAKRRESYGVCHDRFDVMFHKFHIDFEGAEAQFVHTKQDLITISSLFTDVDVMLYNPYRDREGNVVVPMSQELLEELLSTYIEENTETREEMNDDFVEGSADYLNEKGLFLAQQQQYLLVFYIALHRLSDSGEQTKMPSYEDYKTLSVSLKEYCAKYLPDAPPSVYNQSYVFDTSAPLKLQIEHLAEEYKNTPDWGQNLQDVDEQLLMFNKQYQDIRAERNREISTSHTAALSQLAALESDFENEEYVDYTTSDNTVARKPKSWPAMPTS